MPPPVSIELGVLIAVPACIIDAQTTLVSLNTMDMERVHIEKLNPLPGPVKKWADFCEKLGTARQMETLADMFFRSPKMAAEIRIELHLRRKRQKATQHQQRWKAKKNAKQRIQQYKKKIKELRLVLRRDVNRPHVSAHAEVKAAMLPASVGGGASSSAGPVEKANRSMDSAACADMSAVVSPSVMAVVAAAASASSDDDDDLERWEMDEDTEERIAEMIAENEALLAFDQERVFDLDGLQCELPVVVV